MKLRKRIGLGLVATFVFATSLLSFIPQNTVLAQNEAGDNEDMCIPPTVDATNGGKAPTGGWIELRFLNRATIQVVFNPVGNCASPSGLPMTNVSRSDNGGIFASLMNKELIDSNTTDGTWQFREAVDGDNHDDARLDQFTNGSGLASLLDDDTNGADAIIPVDQLATHLANTEYFASFDNGLLDDAGLGIECVAGGDNDSNNNFVFVQIDGEMKWACAQSIQDSWTGLKVGTVFDPDSLTNFNISYVVRVEGDQTSIVHASPGERDSRTFTWCTNVFQNENCQGDLIIEGITPEQLAQRATETQIRVTIRNESNGNTVETFVAGAETASATEIDPINGVGGSTAPSCESEGGEMSWLLCPALRAISSLLQFVDNQVVSLLNVPPDYYNNDQIKESWGRMRNLAFILLIPIFLVMIIGTMLGFGFVDAYTVKRSLPRLLAAVVFISLSLPICQIMINMGNDVGKGIYGLVLGGVTGAREISLADLFDPSPTQGFLFTAGLAVAGVLALGLIPVILLFGLTAALVLLTAFLLLGLRQMLLIALMILSPLAILSWIFPGNDKLWKFWWNSFSKLILLFPIIMLLIGSGKVFAYIIREAGDDSATLGFVNKMLIIVAYVGPYFLIPATFKMAGGAFANLAGMVNNRGKGAFDRLRNARGKQYKSRWNDARGGNYFKGGKEGSLRSRFNRGLEGATNIDKAGFNPMQMRSKMRTALNDHSHDDATKFMKEDHSFNAFSGDDAKLAAAKFEKREDIERELARFDPGRFAGAGNARARTDAATQIMRAQRATNRETFQRARARAMASTGTGYQYTDANGNTVVDVSRMVDDINEAYGNDRGGAGRALAEMRGSLSNSGQIAGMAGFGTWASVMEQRYRGAISNQDAHNVIMDDAIASSSPGQALYGKPTSAAAMGAAHARRIQAVADRVSAARAGIQAGTHTQVQLDTAQADLDAATAAAAGLLDAMGQASPQNASAFANELMGVTIRGSALPGGGGPVLLGPNGQPIAGGSGATGPDVTVRQMIDERMNHEEYRNRRRDYGSQALTQGAAYQQQMAAQNAANAAAGGGGLPGAGGMGGGPPGVNISDSRLKENVHYLETKGGVNLYSFNYIGSNETYVGVLAQEILESHPEAVVKNDLGFYAVDYSKIGVAMTTLDEWRKNANNVLLP